MTKYSLFCCLCSGACVSYVNDPAPCSGHPVAADAMPRGIIDDTPWQGTRDSTKGQVAIQVTSVDGEYKTANTCQHRDIARYSSSGSATAVLGAYDLGTIDATLIWTLDDAGEIASRDLTWSAYHDESAVVPKGERWTLTASWGDGGFHGALESDPDERASTMDAGDGQDLLTW